MSDECIELKNIKYQSMLLSHNYNNDKEIKGNIKDIDELLLRQKKNMNKPWSKLDKLTKLKKLYAYIESIKDKEELTPIEFKSLKVYMRQCLERKKLQRVKDVIYNKETAIIENIPGLKFNKKIGRRFTLKQVDKKGTTLKNLTKLKTKSSKSIRKKSKISKHNKKHNKKHTKSNSSKNDSE